MQQIIESLSRQHHELVQVATEMIRWLEVGKLQRDGAAFAHRALASLGVIFDRHLATEERSLYPDLLHHPDPQLRALAERFWAERAKVQAEFAEYRASWPSAASIAIAPAQFIEETRQMLGTLWRRMKQEDDVLHPEIVRASASH
jgi:Hemerythrin HHE cation binding domain